MPECVTCGACTKFNFGTCTKCYNSNNQNIEVLVPKDEEGRGMSDKDSDFHYGMIKGRIAETLIQELFLMPIHEYEQKFFFEIIPNRICV
jgi:hypothetical protein